jgi:putative PIG3 family NAD(P)H quinone oxidoreductase
MKAIVIDGAGGPEVLKLKEVDDPKAGEGEVLIKIVAAALNRADLMQRQGTYPPPPGASLIPGLECSGTIESVGHGVTQWKVGDEVCALLGGGGYAEKINVPAVQVFPIPKGIKLVDAAGIPEVACTVWSTIFMTCHLSKGESLLVHGGGSGIGTMAIQLAKSKGVKVLVTAGSEEKLKKCLELGADVGINYKQEDFVERAKAETNGKGVDVVLDIMGGSYLPRNIKALAMDGRLFHIATQGGMTGELDINSVIYRRLTVTGAGLRGRTTEKKGEIVQDVIKNVWPEIEAGKVKVIVDCVIPLAEASKAHEILEASTHFGKVILAV